MIRILDDSQSLSALASDTSNGLGIITPISAEVTEELNGIYELEFTVSTQEKRYPELKVGGIVRVNAGETEGEQMFRIYEISVPMNERVNVKACHITYDLNKVAVRPFTATGSVPAKNGMLSNALNLGAFTMTTDITNNTSTFTLDIPRYFRECLGGYEGSLLDVFRPEYEWDNLTVKMNARRGADNGVRIAYGKNLTDFRQEENNASVYTSVLGYAQVDEVVYMGTVYNKVATDNPRILIVDFSGKYESGQVPTAEQLTSFAQSYANANPIEVPRVNIEVSFVPLYQTEEYKSIAPLERVGLGDTVYIDFSKLGVTASSRVIRRVWDVEKERYISVELGSAKSNLNTIIKEAVDSIDVDVNGKVEGAVAYLQEQMDTLSRLIINGLGLHFTAEEVAGGGYRYILHNKETVAASDTQYIMSASGILVSTDYGQTWNAGFDAQGNAVVNSLATITLKALEIYSSAIYFGDPTNRYILAQNYNGANNQQIGVTFDGTGYVRFRPQEQFEVQNLSAFSDSSTLLNRFLMTSSVNNGGPATGLYNYEPTKHISANQVVLYQDYTGAGYNRLHLYNYDTSGTTAAARNYIIMRSDGSMVQANIDASGDIANIMNFYATSAENYTLFNNYQLGQNYVASRFRLSATSTENYFSIMNNRLGSATTSNEILLDTTGTGDSLTNALTFSNLQHDSSNTANEIKLQSQITSNALTLTNKTKQNGNGNALSMIANRGGSFSATLRNYTSAGGTANSIALGVNASSDMYTILMYNNDRGGGSYGNWVDMSSSANTNAFELHNYAPNSAGGGEANSLVMSADKTNGNSVKIANYKSGSEVSSITLTDVNNVGSIYVTNTTGTHWLMNSSGFIPSLTVRGNSMVTMTLTASVNQLSRIGTVCEMTLRFTSPSSVTSNAQIGTLPAGYIPFRMMVFPCGNLGTSTTPALIQILTSGVVRFYGTKYTANTEYQIFTTWLVEY